MYKKILISIFVVAVTLSLSACNRINRHGLNDSPPSHAPAVGRRAHNYVFFPSLSVYYNPLDHVYFYLSNNVWISGPRLPKHFSLDLNKGVKIKIEGKKPYLKFKEHKKKYPPGLKNKSKNKKSGKDNRGYGMGRGMSNGR